MADLFWLSNQRSAATRWRRLQDWFNKFPFEAADACTGSNLRAFGLLGVMLLMFMPKYCLAAGDMSGIHAFFNDDRNQFVDFWLNDDGGVTIKVSNGRPLRPMWVVVHATFISSGQVVGRKDYHVYCEAPNPGGRGKERWFHYGNPGVSGVTQVSISTQKEAPWTKPKGGWEIQVPIYKKNF